MSPATPRLPDRLGLGAALIALLAGAAHAYEPPRGSDGRPDFTGLWTNASLTSLERPEGVRTLVVTPEEAEAIIAAANIGGVPADDREQAPSDSEAGAPPKGSQDFGVRGYNAFWVDPGQSLARVRGTLRSSYIVEPEDGRIPFLDRRAVMEQRRAGLVRYVTGIGGNEGPEALTLAERCLIGFGGTGGPGMLSVLYNNTYQFVQTGDHLMILVEMNHDARIIPIGGRHRPSVIRPWLGDSVARFEGDTLVVETVNVHPAQGASGPVYLSEGGKVTERFTRVADDEIAYEFIVEDERLYKQPWRAELSFHATPGPVYEYACHEGNYALPGILAGARAEERKAR